MAAEQNMGQILTAIEKRTAAEFTGLELRREEGRQRIVKDGEYLASKMEALKGLSWPGSQLAAMLKEKQVRGPVPEPVPEPQAQAQPPKTLASTDISYQPRLPALRISRLQGTDAAAALGSGDFPSMVMPYLRHCGYSLFGLRAIRKHLERDRRPSTASRCSELLKSSSFLLSPCLLEEQGKGKEKKIEVWEVFNSASAPTHANG
ncbi:hypothetical protein K437DRAFT_268936 [Tilletiaria anomala UBC 951]|uniref:Uncharacterized protein n=1 Tax=Tilletiaria anomala (strain ATCC 24038 / CBS 436.72 / UBC 951) TaxID=1037660 RepID=A0A066VQD6_TILAU|nr:uncharacterized protein K437DRAFT_268936 [Tilletiaria anomala UBC 951]KDN43937.1 hypothetical protein K437DRAFT_268936 [Tilletiaria anomala UBC 951]